MKLVDEERKNLKKQTPKVFVLIFFLAVFAFFWQTLEKTREQRDHEIIEALQATMRTTKNFVSIWVREQFKSSYFIANSPLVKSATMNLLKDHTNQEKLTIHPDLRKLQKDLSLWLQSHFVENFSILTTDGVIIASLEDEEIGLVTPLMENPHFLEKARAGFPHFVLPFYFPEGFAKGEAIENTPAMFITTPIFDNKEVIAVFAIRLNPSLDFSQIIHLACTKKRNNFYCFNEEGYFLTEGRFDDELRGQGILLPEQKSLLSLRISDPQVDMTKGFRPTRLRENMPLTLMAKSVTSKQKFTNIKGYRDHRGVPVVGVGSWEEELGLGFAYEIEQEKVDRSYSTSLRDGLLASFIFFILLAGVHFVPRKRQEKRERSSKTVQKNEVFFERRDRFEQVIDFIADGIVVLDNDGLIRVWNRGAENLFGYEKEEILGKSLSQLIFPDGYGLQNLRILDSLSSSSQTNDSSFVTQVRHEMIAMDRNGKEFPAEISNNLIEEENQSWLVGIIHNIRKQKEDKARFKNLSDRLKRATQAAKLGIFDWDVETNFLFWDKSMFELYSVPKDTFTDHYLAWTKCLHPEDKEEILEELDEAIENSEIYDTTFRILLSSGETRYIKADADIYRNDRGKAVRVVGVNYDITEQIEAELALKQLNEQLEVLIHNRTRELDKAKKAALSIMQDANCAKKDAEDALIRLEKSQVESLKLFSAVEATPMMVIITNVKGIIEYVNPKFTEITGYEKREAIGENPRILSSGTHSVSFYKDLWVTLLSGEAWRGEFYNKRKDGSLFWSQASISPIRGEGNEITHCVSITEDITQQKEAESKLHEALLKAEDATRAKSDFLANMSHEIRTPMNAVLGFIELTLHDPKLLDTQRTNLGKAYRAAKDLLFLINDILDVAKFESGKLKIEKVPFNLSNLISNVVQVLEITTKEKGLDFGLQMSPTLPKNVMGDPYKLKQVLMNLTGNAIKFTEKGSVKIQVEDLEEGNFIHFLVVDTGIGIPLHKQQTIFEPFTQVDETTSRRFGGTGLGTTITRQLIQLMGGKVWLESEVDKGSTFHFAIPLPTTDSNPVETDIFSTTGFLLQPRRSFRVLLAEDIEDNMVLATVRLEKAGHIVIPAQNGDEAIEKFKKEEIDIILMDVHMPITDGIQATQEIRKIEEIRGGHIPIIALTASVMREETNKYKEAGMDVVAAKPIDFEGLFQKMEKIIRPGKGIVIKKSSQKMTKKPAQPNIPFVEGVDVKKGLATWQDFQIYVRALNNFAEKYKNLRENMSALLEKKDYKEIQSIAHALRGLSGNLAISEIHTIAEEIEKAAKGKKEDTLLEKLPLLSVALSKVIASIENLEKRKPEQEKAKKVWDQDQVVELLKKILEVLDNYNPYDVEPFLNKLKEYISPQQIKPIENSVSKFNFDRAKDKTKQLAQSLRIDLEK